MRKRRFFQNHIKEFLKNCVMPGKNVCVVGDRTDEILRALEPHYGLLLTDSTDLKEGTFGNIEVRRRDFLQYQDTDRPWDYVIFDDYLHYENNLYQLLQHLKKLISSDTKVIIICINPLSLYVLKFLALLRVATPPIVERNILALGDIGNLLDLCGYEVLDQGYRFIMPFKLLFLGDVMNMLFPRIALLRRLCFGQYIVCRIRERRRNALSCSVVVPCYNEEENVEECIARIPEMGSWREIIVVNDGSTDPTEAIVSRIMQERGDVRLITYEKNRGKGYAVNEGFQQANGDVLMMLDCDMTTPPEELPIFHTVMEDGAEFINGTRIIYPREKKSIGLVNRLGVALFAGLISWITQHRITDTFCGTKVFLKKHQQYFEIKEHLWGDWDLFFAAARYRMKMVELPVHYYARKGGQAKMKAFRHGMILLIRAIKGLELIK